jgi:hypothetical protein
MKGFRTAPTPNKAKVNSLETEMQNLQMAVRMSQMMVQQLLENNKILSNDLGNAFTQLYELQYKYSALQKSLNLDIKVLNDLANEQRLKDFEDAAFKADERENLVSTDVVGTDSTIVITSVAQDSDGNDKGIFRSRLKLAECGVPDLITKLTDKSKGEKVQISLNGIEHTVELLSIKNPVAVASTETTH